MRRERALRRIELVVSVDSQFEACVLQQTSQKTIAASRPASARIRHGCASGSRQSPTHNPSSTLLPNSAGCARGYGNECGSTDSGDSSSY